jgi:hypothetical protein
MRINCVSCGHEINLDHRVFYDYEGRVKCFCCGSMMILKSKQGNPCSVEPLFIPERNYSSRPGSVVQRGDQRMRGF